MSFLSGRLFLSEAPGWFWYQDDGTEWNAWGQFYEFYQPSQTNFIWINQGSATISTTDGPAILTTPPPGSAGENLRLRVESITAEAPTAAPYKVVIGFMPSLDSFDQTSCGIVFRESSTGKIIYFSIKYDTTAVSKSDLILSLDKYTSPTVFDSNYKILTANQLRGSTVWFRITDTGTDLRWSYAPDSLNYTIFDERSRTDFFTTGPNQIGIAVNSNNTSGNAGMILLSWFKDDINA
jgi:hypothetical protein